MFYIKNETFFGHKNYNLSKSQKSIFCKGVSPCLQSKNVFFLFLFSVKIRLQIMFKNVLDRKKPFMVIKTSISQSPKKRIFPKGLTYALVKNCNFFLYLFSLKIRLEIMFNNVLDRKETFSGHKNFSLSKSQKSHFSKGVNPCF